jgi:hypothetical protein
MVRWEEREYGEYGVVIIIITIIIIMVKVMGTAVKGVIMGVMSVWMYACMGGMGMGYEVNLVNHFLEKINNNRRITALEVLALR